MLRRRILASAMASVMAIGSVAVVASADETAAATKNVKTKADLEAYLKELDSFRNNELNDYGSVSGEEMQAALDYADNVLDDADATNDDYTAAYAMVAAVKAKLVIHSAEELKTLIDSCKKIYDGNNIYNEELGDLIYTAASYENFVDAYEEAESVLESADSRIITDAYETLAAAKKGLNALGNVTKAQFRSALKEYESALKKEFAYESWRVGTVDTGWAYWGYQGQTVAWGTLYDHAFSLNEDIKDAYKELDEIQALNKTSQKNIVDAYNACVAATTILNGFTPDESSRASKATVQKLIDQYHGRLVFDYNRTSAYDLYDSVVACVGAPGVNVKQAINAYSYEFSDGAVATANSFYTEKWGYTVNPNGWTWSDSVEKYIAAEITVKTNKNGKAYYIPLDEDGKYWTGAAVTDTKPAAGKYKLVSKGATVDLTDYINVTADLVDTATDNHYINNVVDGDATYAAGKAYAGVPIIGQWGYIGPNGTLDAEATIKASQAMDGSYVPTTSKTGDPIDTYADLGAAMELALTYINGTKDDIAASNIYDIDTTGSIADGSAKGSSAEWALVYRYLKYALSDKYDSSYGTHTKAEVVELIDKCYELADLTGDAWLFSVNHNKLVEARQDAQDWVKAANTNKTYKDNKTPAFVDGTRINGDLVATQVYEALEGFYNKLKNDYDAFKYSFGEIYDYIAEVSDMIDSGDLQPTAALTKALEETAYRLSVVKSIDKDANGDAIELDNDAFTTDRFFKGFNRVYTKGDNEYDYIELLDGTKIKMPKSSANAESASHHALMDAYESLIAAVKEQTEVKYAVGDVDHSGKVDITDASLVLKYAFGVLPTDANFDVALADYDTVGGKGDIADASAILKAAFGL